MWYYRLIFLRRCRATCTCVITCCRHRWPRPHNSSNQRRAACKTSRSIFSLAHGKLMCDYQNISHSCARIVFLLSPANWILNPTGYNIFAMINWLTGTRTSTWTYCQTYCYTEMRQTKFRSPSIMYLILPTVKNVSERSWWLPRESDSNKSKTGTRYRFTRYDIRNMV